MVVRSTCHIAHYALASSLTSPGPLLSGWSTARGEWTGLIHRWQPTTIAGGAAHRQYCPSTVMQRVEARHSPQSSKMARSILGASAELSRWGSEPRQASAVLI